MSDSVFIVWKSDYSVGSRVLDGQHQRLFVTINRLYQALQEGQPQLHLQEALNMLRQYTMTHFTYEERLQRQSGFPHLDEHQKAHHLFVQQLDAFELQVTTRPGDLTYDVFAFLKVWLVNHILRMDREYAPFISQAKQGAGQQEQIYAENHMG
jgi:hemerythrin-like metal-binding protein